MAGDHVEVGLDGLDVWWYGEPDSAETEALTMSPADGRQLVDRLCKELGYWPTRPRRPGDIDVQVYAPKREPDVLIVPVVDPRGGGGMRA